MNFFVLGLNYQSTPLALRERFAVAKNQVPDLLAYLKKQTQLQELIILSTCNRCEFYGIGGEVQALMGAVCEYAKVACEAEIQKLWYLHYNEAALRHLLRVTIGLDSMILGEPEIFGQVKNAYEMAVANQSVAKTLHRLFQFSFHISKKIRHETEIGKNPVSVAFASVKLAKHIFSDLTQCTLVLVGAGETISLLAKHFFEQGIKNFIFVNRTYERAQQLANAYQGDAYSLKELPLVISRADIMVVATENQETFITPTLFDPLARVNTLLMLDLSVPRNIAVEVGDIQDCYLYTIDDLQSIVLDNLEQRQKAAYIAQELIDQEVQAYFNDQKNSIDGASWQLFEKALNQTMQDFYEAHFLSVESPDLHQALTQLTKKLKHQAFVFVQKVLKTSLGHL